MVPRPCNLFFKHTHDANKHDRVLLVESMVEKYRPLLLSPAATLVRTGPPFSHLPHRSPDQRPALYKARVSSSKAFRSRFPMSDCGVAKAPINSEIVGVSSCLAKR